MSVSQAEPQGDDPLADDPVSVRLLTRAAWERASSLIAAHGEDALGRAIQIALRHRLRRDIAREAAWLDTVEAVEEWERTALLPAERLN